LRGAGSKAAIDAVRDVHSNSHQAILPFAADRGRTSAERDASIKANVKVLRMTILGTQGDLAKDRHSAEDEVAGAYVGVKTVAAGAGFLEGAEETVTGFAEGSRGEVACVDRGVYVTVVVGVADLDAEITGVKFDVLVAGDAFDRQIAERHAYDEAGEFGDLDGDCRAILNGAAGDLQVGVIPEMLESDVHFAGFLGVVTGGTNGDFAGVAAYYTKFTGAEIEADQLAGGEVYVEGVIVQIGDGKLGLGSAR
jgi:hypothetical protein